MLRFVNIVITSESSVLWQVLVDSSGRLGISKLSRFHDGHMMGLTY